MQNKAAALQRSGKSVVLVLTMGTLHSGPISMLEQANQIADITVVAILINPAKFGPSDDIIKYSHNSEADLKVCQRESVDIVFTPQVNSIYPKEYSTYIQEELISKRLAGPARPLFLREFSTIINLFLNIIRPQYLLLQQKGIHQTAIIKRMVNDLHIPVVVVIIPIVREEDGLAASTSNRRLEGALRVESSKTYQALIKIKDLVKKGPRSVGSIVAEVTQFLSQSLRFRGIHASITDPETTRCLRRKRSHHTDTASSVCMV